MRWKWALAVFFFFILPIMGSRPSAKIFSGNVSFSNDELLAFLEAKRTEAPLSLAGDDELTRTQRLLTQFYQDRGFPLARVRLETDPPQFIFHIAEGPKADLGSIEFTGNTEFADETLAQTLSIKGKLDFNELESALDRLRTLYREAGYARVAIAQPQIEVVETTGLDHFPVPFRRSLRNRVHLKIAINEGKLFRYRHIAVSEKLADQREEFPLKGEIYRESDLLRLRTLAYARFLAKGAVVKQFQIYQNFLPDAGEVDLEAICEIYPPLIVKRIEFVGNRRYPDGFYRRELKFHEEEILDPRKVEESLLELLETGALSSLNGEDVELSVDEARLTVDVTIRLHERDRSKMQFSLGPDGLGGLEAGLFYSALNLLGLGEKLGLDLNVGSSSSEMAISLASRYLLGTQIPASLALRVFRRNTKFELPGADQRLRTLFSSSATGLVAGGRYRIRRNQTAGLTATVERIAKPIRSDHLAVTPSWRFTRMRGESPQKLEASTRFSFFGGDSSSWNLRADAGFSHNFQPENLQSKGLGFRVHAAHASFFGDAEPLFERILKDDWELRGFSYATGPWAESSGELLPVGGDSLFTLSAEYPLPLGRRTAFVPFFDTGVNLASSQPGGGSLLDITRNVWRASAGAELRLKPSRQLPAARLIFSWNPLRFDETVLTKDGLARLRDPAWGIRVGIF